MDAKERADVLLAFKERHGERGNILLLTYQIGSTGLNLQHASTVLLMDYFWNNGTTSQAVARVLRPGQIAPKVNIYYFTSTTAMENSLFSKHLVKLDIINELETGRLKSKKHTMRMQDIIRILKKEENETLINELIH
jgi:SNF2 family DNA or RNA helicase